MKLGRVAAAGGVAGPVLFTVAWVVGSLRQAGHSAAEVQLSGLAAEDARDPQIMMAGFVVLGVGTVVFGAGLGRVAAPRSAGPWLVLVAGAASVAVGLFRRDHMLLAGPGFAGESWHNQVHDVVSGVAYGAMLAAPLVLGRRWRGDPDWGGLSRPVQVLALAGAAALAVFASGVAGPYNGVVQRIAVTLALTAEILMAGRMLTLPVLADSPHELDKFRILRTRAQRTLRVGILARLSHPLETGTKLMNVKILQVTALLLPMPSGGDSLSAGMGTGSGPGWPSFRRIVDIPFETCVAALEGWRREGHNSDLQLGQSTLRGPIEHDRGSGTCRVEVRLVRGPLRPPLRMRLNIDCSSRPSSTALELIPCGRVRATASYFRAGHLLLDLLTHSLQLEQEIHALDLPSGESPTATHRTH